MDTIYVDLVSAEDLTRPIRVTVTHHMPLKAFLALAEKVLSTEIYSLYINDKRLSDMLQIREGDTIIAISTISPNLSKCSFFKHSDNVGSWNFDSVDNQMGIKVAVLGPQGVGKTSLILRFIHGFFKLNDTPTVMEAEYEKTIQVRGKDISMAVYDTAGEISYDSETLKRLSNLDAFLLVIGVDRLADWPIIVKYHKLIKKQMTNPLILLLITKIDLYDSKGQGVNLDIKKQLNVISNYAKDQHLLLLKTSAKTNKNIHKVFATIADRFANPDKFAADRPSVNEPEPNHPFLFRVMDKLLNYRLRCLKESD